MDLIEREVGGATVLQLTGRLTVNDRPGMLKGAVAAVLLPGKPDSAGAQFFVAVSDQAGLDGQYTVFGEIADGMDVVQAISETPVDASGVATARVEI